MMLASLNSSAEVNINTGNLFGSNNSPFPNSPFAGGTPKNIERNLFSSKQRGGQAGSQYNVDFNHNKYQRNRNIYNITEENSANIAMSGSSASSGVSNLRKYNTPLNNNAVGDVASYNLTRTANINLNTEAFSEEENTTPPSQDNNYTGAGAPSTYNGPIGDMMLPLILFALAYVAIKRSKK